MSSECDVCGKKPIDHDITACQGIQIKGLSIDNTELRKSLRESRRKIKSLKSDKEGIITKLDFES